MGGRRGQQPGINRSRSNHRLPSNWADSEETHKAPWTLVSATGTMNNGSVVADQLQVVLQGAGECLIDNVQVLTSAGSNLIANSSFETDALRCDREGTESLSSLEVLEVITAAGLITFEQSIVAITRSPGRDGR